MERNNPMVIFLFKLSFILMFLFTFSCKEPLKENFIGKWSSSNPETILDIMPDGSFSTEKFIIKTSNGKTEVINGNGVWTLIKRDNSFQIELIFYEPERISNTYFDSNRNIYKKQSHSEQLFIKGSNFFGLSAPWYFYQTINSERDEKWLVFTKNR